MAVRYVLTAFFAVETGDDAGGDTGGGASTFAGERDVPVQLAAVHLATRIQSYEENLSIVPRRCRNGRCAQCFLPKLAT